MHRSDYEEEKGKRKIHGKLSSVIYKTRLQLTVTRKLFFPALPTVTNKNDACYITSITKTCKEICLAPDVCALYFGKVESDYAISTYLHKNTTNWFFLCIPKFPYQTTSQIANFLISSDFL
uniref:Uncharacterized protein n=1 Tax=Populus davidiana TaxID=266767 RepID=A0A6M2EAZ9_9ROSI